MEKTAPFREKICAASGTPFVIDEVDTAYYKKIGVPEPTLSPSERQRRRMSFRNERNFYYRKCNLCQKQIISMYDQNVPFPVYCNGCWWSDKWNAQDFGLDYDFSKGFFEQMKELQNRVPRLALHQKNNENGDFTNHSENLKNCYMCVDTAFSQDIYYSKWIIKCTDCTECYNIEGNERCVECQYQAGGYNNAYTFFSDFTKDSYFTYNCVNCQHCFMCTNLQRREYCIRNTQVTKEEYEAFMATINLGSYRQIKALYSEYRELIKAAPKRAALITNCENVTGDCLFNCKNVFDSFDVIESENARYCYESGHMYDCYDTYESAFDCKQQYETHGCNRGSDIKFGNVSYDVSSSEYIDICHNSRNLFGCIGIQRGEYMIFNKQYSQEQYHAMVAHIKEKMREEGSYGEFFPTWLSTFDYNETIAAECFPLSEAEALSRGYRWKQEAEDQVYQGESLQLPDDVADTPDTAARAIITSEESGKAYKIIPQELALYKKLGIALPRITPKERYKNRLALRNPRMLWSWNCAQCNKGIQAPYDPIEAHKVYCNDCFNSSFYG